MTTNNKPLDISLSRGQEAVWLWVLTAAITDRRDKLLILEDEFGDYVPVFQAKEEGRGFIDRLDPGGKMDYHPQAMHLFDLRALATAKTYRVMVLDGQGQVLGQWRPEPVA
ncbi:MAG: hypothetical protein LBT86_10690 [Deltaproteobacteria bacterium]|jgi:hypothetical protein|nr:hypothetical protein [Deltaproteobacteria bacterium]